MFSTEYQTLTEITFKAFKIPHHRYGRRFWLPSSLLRYFWKGKSQHEFILIYCKNKGSLRVCWSPVVCNLQPCYVKVMLQNKGCSRRDPFPMLLKKKAWSNWIFSYYARKNSEKKRRGRSADDYLQLISQMQWGITWLHAVRHAILTASRDLTAESCHLQHIVRLCTFFPGNVANSLPALQGTAEWPTLTKCPVQWPRVVI